MLAMVLPEGQAKMRHPASCPEPVCWVGRHRWRSGEWVTVWSCEGHADDLIGIRRPPLANYCDPSSLRLSHLSITASGRVLDSERFGATSRRTQIY